MILDQCKHTENQVGKFDSLSTELLSFQGIQSLLVLINHKRIKCSFQFQSHSNFLLQINLSFNFLHRLKVLHSQYYFALQHLKLGFQAHLLPLHLFHAHFKWEFFCFKIVLFCENFAQLMNHVILMTQVVLLFFVVELACLS